ncbi:MAG: hypothetical protein KDA52_03435 [Planctomycetaceae bacterium]|nr:hypothetical protein [Planctomycetaceae bacterium]
MSRDPELGRPLGRCPVASYSRRGELRRERSLNLRRFLLIYLKLSTWSTGGRFSLMGLFRFSVHHTLQSCRAYKRRSRPRRAARVIMLNHRLSIE